MANLDFSKFTDEQLEQILAKLEGGAKTTPEDEEAPANAAHIRPSHVC